MSEKTVLVIDDSATIRRLVDSELGNAGYRVIMAPTAEEGIAMAVAEQPDLILLDHQLPGTTGYEVCCQLLENSEVQSIPVVVSSTLRKKAYAEYTDFPNVTDMLPKPYTGDLLRTTVANAIETASMVVQSQSHGTAVPEVIDSQNEGALQGSFKNFGLREVVDFLNNGEKCGRLEVEFSRCRISIYVANGRIQGVTASGFEIERITSCLPDVISDLAPMTKFTLRGKNCSEVDGIVELLDNKVLDARLLRQLLRHQSAILLSECIHGEPESFRFEQGQQAPSLFSKLPLDLSLLALTVEASMVGGELKLDQNETTQVAFTRTPQRGQNLDRAGLSATQMKLLNLTSSPTCIADLAAKTGLGENEVGRILRGFVNAELVSRQNLQKLQKVIAVSQCTTRSKQLSDFFKINSSEYNGRCVRDGLAVKLMLRRVNPDILLFDLDDESTSKTLQQLKNESIAQLENTVWMGVASNPEAHSDVSDLQVVSWPEHMHELEYIFSSHHDNPELLEAK